MASAVLRTPPLDDLHRKGAPHASSKKSYGGNLHQDSLSSTTSSGNNGQGDLARILEPAMKKLATVESQRVLSVVDECNKKMQVLSSIPVFIKQPSRYSVSLGSDIMKQLEDHRQLTSEYRDALRAMGERVDSIENLAASTSQLSITDSVSSVLSSTPPKPRKLDPLNPRNRSAEELTELLKQSGRTLLRSFLRHPSAMSVVKGLGQEHMPSSCSSFLKELQILRGVEHEKLLTTQQEKENQKHQISTLSTKLQQTTSTVMQLEKELRTAEEIREEEKRKREALIEKLKSNISTVKKLSEESNHRVKTDAMKQKEASKGVHNSRRTQMEEELGALQKQYKALLAENKQNEIQLRSKAVKREVEVDNWINKYDSEMDSQQDKLEEMQCEYEKETEQFKELKERYTILEIEYSRVMEEKRIAREKAEEADRKMNDMVRAATIIQTFWRLYKRRKLSSKSKQKSGKKKSKGKKKK